MGALRHWLEADHREMDALLDRAVVAGVFDPVAFAELRRRLLRHIGIEEKLLLAAAREARGGEPIERAETLRRDHAAIAALLVPTPDAALVTELRSLLEPHELLEEGADGVYEECERLIGRGCVELLDRARAYPLVPVAKHFDGHGTVRTALDAIALAARVRLRARTG